MIQRTIRKENSQSDEEITIFSGNIRSVNIRYVDYGTGGTDTER